ncbi:MAG TPA: hypothetical protein VGI85_06535 [Chthoniobacterales bacterium]|jgi:hypothetical protein
MNALTKSIRNLTSPRRNGRYPDNLFNKFLPPQLVRPARIAEAHIREGRFQRSLSLLAGVSSVLAGAEVAYEHYKGSYGQQIMYSPVVCGAAMTIAGLLGAISKRAARTVLRWTSIITLLDGLTGFCFHIRGIARKPGGWRLPIPNIIMGPPIFAPLLFGVSAYLGVIASFLRPEEARPMILRQPKARLLSLSSEEMAARHPWTIGLREGRFQKHLAAATIAGTFCSGAEALYSHYKNNFRYFAQWTPIIIAPLLMGAAAGAIVSPKVARTWLPAMSALAIADGTAGFFYHARGVIRRPAGLQKPLYNILYGPPIFAPLLFAACGTVGLLASLMRRER